MKDYTHQDRMGSTTNLTDQFGRVVGRADYNEWGQITYKDALDITSSYRRIYPQLSYTGHDWDDVLGMYYAKARFYDADTKRFVAIDPIKGNVTDPLSLVPYIYCVDNPLRWVDPLGLMSYPAIFQNPAYPPNFDPADLSKPLEFPQGSKPVDFYYNGKKSFVDEKTGTHYAINYNGSTYVVDHLERTKELLDMVGASWLSRDKDRKGEYVVVKGQRIYFQKFGCHQYLSVRDVVTAAGLEDTLSWWYKDGKLQVLLNSVGKNTPYVIQREGDVINATIYVKPKGLAYEPITTTNDKGYKTYWDAMVAGIKEYWNKFYRASEYENWRCKMKRIFSVLLLLVLLLGGTKLLDTSTKDEELPSASTKGEELPSVEEAREIFKTYRRDMEAVKEECEAKFEWVNIDADEDGNLEGELQPKDGGLDTIVSINGENLSEYTEKADLIILLFKELQAARISYTRKVPDRGAIMAFDLKHTSVPNGNTDTRLPATCGIVCSTERFGDYVDLDGDWFYCISIMG